MRHLPDPVLQPEFYASVPAKRLFAWLVDFVVIFILSILVLPLTGFLGVFVFAGLLVVIGFAYRVVTIANRSATWGMRFMAIELRQSSGRQMDLGAAFLHTLGYTVSLSLPILQVISIVLMLTSARGQGLTDHVLGTVALNRRK